MSKRMGTIAMFILLFVLAGIPSVVAEGIDDADNVFTINQSDTVQTESVIELTDEQFEREIQEFYERHASNEVTINLHDDKGIEPSLLPANIVRSLDENVKIVAYKETKSPGVNKDSRIDVCDDEETLDNKITLASCTVDRTLDITLSSPHGGVQQFLRVIGTFDDNYPPCNNLVQGGTLITIMVGGSATIRIGVSKMLS
jgi:hypothetical protein